ncbi:MAG: YceI family protein [Thiotrichales bacterium]|nr:MAG: YceI family protein [Thiotrichales bacterium]
MTPLSVVAEVDVCAPFKDGVVDTTVVSKMLSAAEDGHLYRINPASSRVGFCVETPIGLIEGEFRDFTGGLTFLEGHAADDEQALVMVKTKSLDTKGIFIENMLKGEKFFDVDNYPEILFVSTGFKWVSETEAVLLGELTMHGVTKEVGFHVELVEQPDDDAQQHIVVKATTLIRRSEFGLTSLSPMVSDSVSLCMSVDAVRFGS